MNFQKQLQRGYEVVIKCYVMKEKNVQELFQQLDAINNKLGNCELGNNIVDLKRHLNLFPNYETFDANINSYIIRRNTRGLIFSKKLNKLETGLIWSIIGKDKKSDSSYHKLIKIIKIIIRLLERSIRDADKAFSLDTKLSWINDAVNYIGDIYKINLNQLAALRRLNFVKLRQELESEKEIRHRLNKNLYTLSVMQSKYFSLFSNLKPISRRSFMKAGMLGIAATFSLTAFFSYSNWEKIYIRTLAPDKIDRTLDLYKQHHTVHFICLKFLDCPEANFKLFEKALWDWIELYGPAGIKSNGSGDSPEHFIWAIDHILMRNENDELKKDMLIMLMKVSIFYYKHNYFHTWCAMELFIYGQPFVRRNNDREIVSEWRKACYKTAKSAQVMEPDRQLVFYALWLTSTESYLGPESGGTDNILREIGVEQGATSPGLKSNLSQSNWSDPKQVANFNYNFLLSNGDFMDFLNQIKAKIPFWPEDCS